ncbi:MAG: zinc ABC transporter substrate-binding protein AztC [Aeromicrobium sp.]
MRALAAVAAAALLAGLTACAPVAERAQIVVTTNILGDVVSEIVGDAATVSVLMPPGADPHSFGVSAQDAASLRSAELVIFSGLGLEEGVLHHVEAAEADGVPTLEAGESADPITFADGDTAGQDDPHFWTDPSRMRPVVEAIAAAVIEHVDGVDAAVVQDRAAAYDASLVALEEEMEDAFAAIPAERRLLVTNHHVFAYLAERFEFQVVGAVVPSGTTLASPSASDLASLVDAVTGNDIPAIFVDSSQPQRLADVLADEAGLVVEVRSLFTESLSAEDGDGATYLAMMRFNTAEIVAGLA